MLNSHLRLNGRSCRESPAGSALSLILNWIDHSFCSPVDFGWDIFNRKNFWLWSGVVSWSFESEHFFVLILGPGRKEVVSNSEGICWVSVDFIVFSIFLIEDLLSEIEFFSGTVRKVVLSNVVKEI